MYLASLPPHPNKAFLGELPGGIAGTRATLATMARLIQRAKVLPIIRALAVSIVAGLPHKAYAEQAAAVTQWVQENIQFVRDVRGVETLTPPAYLLRTRAGDCDDQAMLAAALLEAIGLRARLVAGGRSPEQMVHVWAEVEIGRRWYACETTERWPMGRRPRFANYLVHDL